jgi:UDP:flavonoid glycosyltransferase YjiC (YdhE family)
MTADAPYVRIVSCNPLEIRGESIAPTFAGYAADDPGPWGEFLAEFDRTHGETWEGFNTWVQTQGAPPLPRREFVHTSPVANLYVYPEELDYIDARPLDATWHRMDSSVRETDDDYVLPEGFHDRSADSSLIYLSLGSLGGADIGLLQRIIDLLATTRHKVIVSMGPRSDELRLADNMTGAAIVPQTKVIPQVNLVMTHGGNNTTTEAMHFGKPMIVLPLFWDQYDNAQRVHERGYGRRMASYDFADWELLDAIEELLHDNQVRERAARAGVAIRARDGLRRGAEVIERVGLGYASRRQRTRDEGVP